MCKPRFPLSVDREFKYRSCITSTGECLETDSFKKLYRFTRHHLRGECLYGLKSGEYRYLDATIQFGYETIYEVSKGHYYSEWTTIKDYGCLQISSVSEWWYSCEDENNHIISTKGEC